MFLIRALYIAFICFLPFTSFGQKKIKTFYNGTGYQHVIKKPQVEFKDEKSLIIYLNDLKSLAIKKGYLLFSVDSITHIDELTRNVFLHIGEHFQDGAIKITNLSELQFLQKNSRLNEKVIAQTPINPKEISQLLIDAKNTYTNNGYPFAQVELQNININNTTLYAELNIKRGPHLNWKQIHIKGDSTLSEKYISNLLGIKINQPFNEKLLNEVSQRIKQINFLEEVKPNEILFTNDGAELYLYLKSIPVSAINGIIGFQPSSTNEKLLITGDLNLKLVNVLKRGELLDFRWQSIREQTQSLNAHLNYPFLFKSPFGIDCSFDLYKRDTTFLELSTTIGIQYHLNRGSYLKGYYENLSSNVLSGGANNPSFSKLGSVNVNMYGIGLKTTNIDYLPNPSKGYNVYIESSAGSRSNRLNDTSTVVKSLTFKGEFQADFYIPLTRRHVLRLSNHTEYYSADGIFQNELYRFGGLNSQRGFNEDALLASTKSTSTLEYRFLLDKNSHVFAFGDFSWYENNSVSYFNDTPFGFGVGFSFSTNLGVFSISYALGKQFNNPILFSDSKIHFGYIFYF